MSVHFPYWIKLVDRSLASHLPGLATANKYPGNVGATGEARWQPRQKPKAGAATEGTHSGALLEALGWGTGEGPQWGSWGLRAWLATPDSQSEVAQALGSVT